MIHRRSAANFSLEARPEIGNSGELSANQLQGTNSRKRNLLGLPNQARETPTARTASNGDWFAARLY